MSDSVAESDMVALILESVIDRQNIAWSFRHREPLWSNCSPIQVVQ